MAGESGTTTQTTSPVGTSSSMIATPENEVKQLDAYKAGTLPAYMFNRSMTNPLSVAQYNQQVAAGGPLTITPTGTTIIRGKTFSGEQGGQSTFGPKQVRTAGDAQLEALKLPSDWNTYDAAKKINWYNTNAVSEDKLLSAGASQQDIDWMKQNGYVGLKPNWDQQTPEQKIAYFNQNGVTADTLLQSGVKQSDIDWMVSKGYNPRWVTTPEGWESYTPQKKIEFFNNNNITPTKLLQMGVPQSDIDWMLTNGYTGRAPVAPLGNNTVTTNNNNNTVTTNGNNTVNTGGNNTVNTGGNNTTVVVDNLSPDGRGYITVGGASYSVFDGNKKPPGNWTWNPAGDMTPGMWVPSSGNVNTNKPAGTNIGTGGPVTLAANGTTNVKGYYNGTMGVKGYANGTTDADEDDDPWAWTSNKNQVVAPLGSKVTASTEQAAPRMPDKTEQVLGNMATTKGIDIAEKGIMGGIEAYKSAAPLANSAMASADMALGGAGGSAGAAALTEAAGTGAAMAETGALASGLSGAGTAMMSALASNPIGWAVGAGLLAKKLKLF
jgi:hypothetical protein